ncbi:MAG TPA: PAS domain S-box protein [Bacteroidales bacterium]
MLSDIFTTILSILFSYHKGFIILIFFTCILILLAFASYLLLKSSKFNAVYGKGAHFENQNHSTSYQEILRSLRNQEFLVNFTNYFNSPGDFSNKINTILNILGRYIKVERICIFVNPDESQISGNIYKWCKTGIESLAEDYKEIIYKPSFNTLKAQLIKDGILRLTNKNNLPRDLAEIFISRKIKSWIAMPIYVYGEFYGFIQLDSNEMYPWDDIEVGFLKTISMILSSAFERRLADEEIKNSEAKFKGLFNHNSDVIFIYNLQGELIEVNNQACEALEMHREDILSKNIESVFPADRIPREKLYMDIETQHINIFESEFQKSNGKTFPVEINSRPILFNNQNAVLCMARDISERKEVQRQILSAIIQTEEKERGRIARDLHDGLGPLLSSLKLYAKVLGTATDTEKRAQLLTTTNEVIDESMLLIKEISNNLSPHVLNDFGLASAIQSFCKKITLAKDIDIKFNSNVFDVRFETNVEMVLFRVLKELVNNTIKHALASQIEIFLLRTENVLSLIYSDNGIGFEIKKVLGDRSSGMGISNIVNRISSINGRLLFDSQAGKGIQMKIEVELDKS